MCISGGRRCAGERIVLDFTNPVRIGDVCMCCSDVGGMGEWLGLGRVGCCYICIVSLDYLCR